MTNGTVYAHNQTLHMNSLLTVLDRYAADAFAVALIASGVICCFLGYRLFRIVLGVTGFLGGGALVWTLAAGAGYGQGVVLAAALLGALLGALAMFSLFYVGVFLFGCSLSLLISIVVFSVVRTELNVLLACIFALVGGLVTLLIRKGLVVASTALTGSWAALSGTSHFVENMDLVRLLSEPDFPRSQSGLHYVVLALWLALGIGGIAVQLRGLRRKRKYR